MQPSFSSILYCGNIFLFENIFFPKKTVGFDSLIWNETGSAKQIKGLPL